MKQVIVHDYHGDHLEHWLPGLVTYLRNSGAHVRVITRKSDPRTLLRAVHKQRGVFLPLARLWLRHLLKRIDHVFMWNGEDECHGLLRQECASLGLPCSILEVGYFPQESYFTIDSQGINATSALMDDSLEWVGTKHLRHLDALRGDYLGERSWRGGGGFILVPLQLAKDTNIRNNCNFRTMQEFIEHCEKTFPNRRLVFKKHPRDDEDYSSSHQILLRGDFLDLAQDADLVYGINSTCLLESSLLGAPTEAVGNGFLKAHPNQQERLLAALADKQIPITETDLSYWLEKYAANDRATPKCA